MALIPTYIQRQERALKTATAHHNPVSRQRKLRDMKSRRVWDRATSVLLTASNPVGADHLEKAGRAAAHKHAGPDLLISTGLRFPPMLPEKAIGDINKRITQNSKANGICDPSY